MMRSKYQLHYGKTLLSFSLPENYSCDVFTGSPENDNMNTGAAVAGPAEADIIIRALENPIGTPSIEELISGSGSVCIVVPDQTRKCRLPVLLPILLSKLKTAGIRHEGVKIIIAYGSHRPCTHAELNDLLGPEIPKQNMIIHHNSKCDNDLVHVGTTKRGTEVTINRHLLDTDKVILISGVQDHYFAGFGGGPKLIVPGCAGYETIRQNHSYSVNPNGPCTAKSLVYSLQALL